MFWHIIVFLYCLLSKQTASFMRYFPISIFVFSIKWVSKLICTWTFIAFIAYFLILFANKCHYLLDFLMIYMWICPFQLKAFNFFIYLFNVFKRQREWVQGTQTWSKVISIRDWAKARARNSVWVSHVNAGGPII